MCCPRQVPRRDPDDDGAPASNAPTRMCGYATTATGLVNTAQMSVSPARPDSALTVKPTGFCIHRVSRENEVRGQVRTDGYTPNTRQVNTFRQPIPAEDPQPDEGCLQEEGEQCLHGKWRAENIADEPRILTPPIPISNSRTMPVTTPTAKQIRNGLLQNFPPF